MAPYSPPNIAGMDKLDSVGMMEGYENWSPDELADYFEEQGLGDYREVLTFHKITGRIAPQLKDEDLRDMGIKVVGDRCRFRHIIKGMNRKARNIQRNKIVWSGKEQLWFDKCEGCMNTCCGIFPEDPSTYKLTNNHLKVRAVEPARIGPIRLCCCNQYKTNNIDLSSVQDIDMENIPPPVCQQLLCCANGKEVLDITIADQDSVFVIVAQGDGEAVTSMILNQVEESQMIERD